MPDARCQPSLRAIARGLLARGAAVDAPRRRTAPRRRGGAAAFVGAILAAFALASAARAQELAVPAVDDAPTAQLTIEQAADQARANPREAVRLLLEALDSGASRLVGAGADRDLFVSVAARVHALLQSDAALREAFRQEAQPGAAQMLARGELEALVATRLDTDAGIEAVLLLAQSAMARGHFATAAGLLDRCGDSDLLAGRRAVHHAAMLATARARLGDPAGSAAARAQLERAVAAAAGTAWQAEAAAALAACAPARAGASPSPGAPSAPSASSTVGAVAVGGPGRFDPGAAGAWSETWTVPLLTPLPMPSLVFQGMRAAGAERPLRATAAPAADAWMVYLDDGNGLAAYDRLSGRRVWGAAPASSNGDASLSTLGYLALGGDAVVAYSTAPSPLARPGSGTVGCYAASNGALRWTQRLDRVDGRTDIDGVQPQGAPLIVDGRVIVATRRTTPRMETVASLLALDLEKPRPSAWSRVVSTSASARVRAARVAESPVLASGVLYLASASGAVAAVDPGDGHVRWLRRVPVPVRDNAARIEPSETLTPGVAGGRVYAVSPDRTRIDAYDAATGAPVTAVAATPEGPLGEPAYMLGDLASGLVLAVGDRVVCFDAAQPQQPRWSWPARGAASARPQGRVQWAIREGAPPVAVVPTDDALLLLDGMDGHEVMRLAGVGPCNPLISGNQLLAGQARALSSYMPAADAERMVRARLAASPAPDAAVALLRLARQVRAAPMAVEAARETLRRAEGAADAAAVREELLDLLLAIDAEDFAAGADRAALDELVSRAAEAAGRPLRGALARADRALRRGDARAGAQLTIEAAMAAPEGATIVLAGRRASIDALALERLALATAREPRAIEDAAAAADRALRSAPASALPALRRRVARLVPGTATGSQALAAMEPAAAATLAPEVAAAAGQSGAPLPPAARGAPATAAAPLPRAQGPATRIVEFPGRLPRMAPGVAESLGAAGRLVCARAQMLLLRTPPAFAPAWQVPLAARDPALLPIDAGLLLWDEPSAADATARRVGFDGAVAWSSAPAGELFAGLGAALGADAPTVDLGDGRSVPASQVLPLATASTLVLARRDGAVLGLDLRDGAVRWKRPEAMRSIAAAARHPLAVAIAGEGGSDDAGPVRVELLAADTGEPIAHWSPDDASDVRWLRVEPSGLVVVATDVGIEARRLAGGDERAPYWSVTVPDARGTVRGWSVGRWIVALDRFDATIAIDARTGVPGGGVFEVPGAPPLGTLREIVQGDRWAAFVRDDRVDFFDLQGAYLGRDAPLSDRAYIAVAGSRDRLFLLDAGGDRSELSEGRFGVELHELDPAAGGLAAAPPLMLHTVGQRISAVTVVDGWVIVSNGSVLQAVQMRGSSASAPAAAGAR
jgi:outer membrane protein assembly factor BamB